MKFEPNTVNGADPVRGAAQQPAADREVDLDALRGQQRGSSSGSGGLMPSGWAAIRSRV